MTTQILINKISFLVPCVGGVRLRLDPSRDPVRRRHAVLPLRFEPVSFNFIDFDNLLINMHPDV